MCDCIAFRFLYHDECFSDKHCHCLLVYILMFVSILICLKVMDAHGEKSLALFPAKFQKSMWIKRGLSYVRSNSILAVLILKLLNMLLLSF